MASTVETVASGTGKWLGKAYHGVGGAWGVLGLMGSLGTYSDARKNGHGVVNSALRAAGDQAFWTMAGPLGLAVMAGQLAPVAMDAYKGYNRELAQVNRPFSHQYQDTQSAYTMRQRAVQAIQQSKVNARSALGNEAMYMHR